MRHPFQLSLPFEPMDAAAAQRFDSLLRAALAEDVGDGDVTTAATIDSEAAASAEIVARTGGVVAGLEIAARAFLLSDPSIAISMRVVDGASVQAHACLASLRGRARGILTGERVALNFLGRLSGIATQTRAYVDAVAGLPVRIVDTRKTTPGLRALERYAVRAGGGANHRLGLFDAVLVKDNHVAVVGSVAEAVRLARAKAPPHTIIEVECESLAQVREAVDAGTDAILLDNLDEETMRAAVRLAKGRAVLEASGGMSLERVRIVAETGVDAISVGALTKNATSLDVALDFVAWDHVASDLEVDAPRRT